MGLIGKTYPLPLPPDIASTADVGDPSTPIPIPVPVPVPPDPAPPLPPWRCYKRPSTKLQGSIRDGDDGFDRLGPGFVISLPCLSHYTLGLINLPYN